MSDAGPGLRGLMAEYETLEDVRATIDRLADEGYLELDAYLPYPDPAVMERIGRRPSGITRTGGAFALLGASLAYGFQWLITVRIYPLDVGGRPHHSLPAFVPITFEMGVLFCGIATFVAILVTCGMPTLWRPEFEIEGFERVSIDRFWVHVSDTDSRFDERLTRELLEQRDPIRIIDVPLSSAQPFSGHQEGARP
jgi:hypothetical protein